MIGEDSGDSVYLEFDNEYSAEMMDIKPEDTSPFFELQSFKPLERFPWDDALPSLARGAFEPQSRAFFKDASNLYALNIFGDDTRSEEASNHTPLSSPEEQIHELGREEYLWDLESISGAENEGDAGPLKSWDSFPNHQQSLPSTGPVYLSESGDTRFDAALVFQASQTGLENSGRVARTGIFILSVFKLGMGWNSMFFRYNEQKRKFEKAMRDVRVSGISLTALDAFIEEVLHCGTQVRWIRSFLASVPTRVDMPVALANLSRAASVLLHGLESQLFELFKSRPSLLETQMLFRRTQCVVKCAADILESAGNASTEAQVISLLFVKCENLSQEYHWLSDILHEILTVTSRSWLSQLAQIIGLPVDQPLFVGINGSSNGVPAANSNIGKESFQWLEMDPKSIADLMPDIVSSEHREAITESARSLSFLRSYHSDHPLTKPRSLASIQLECGFTWEYLDQIQRKASFYEQIIRSEILRYNRASSLSPTNDEAQYIFVQKEEAVEHNPIRNTFELEKTLVPSQPAVLQSTESVTSNKLHQLVSESPCIHIKKNLAADVPFGPPLTSALYLSFAPVISAQTRLINFSCLHLLFKKHKLREHVHSQWRFQLLGDGSFLAKLSAVLFDPDMHSGERKAGVARGGTSTGLRLGNRDTWPPASSELRLVLTGLLAECHAEDEASNNRSEASKRKEELPGRLSFSIRELSDEELVKCKNPNSVQALDFLRLQYRPPPMLADVLTTNSLSKYDRIFKHLLRLTRLLSTARSIVRTLSEHSWLPSSSYEQKFCFEASHFVQAIGEYCFHTCVGGLWENFEKTLKRIERCIDQGDIDGTIEHAKSLRRLREYHEDVLDHILFAMLLSKKHAQANTLLENIFDTILAFSRQLRGFSDRASVAQEQSIPALYSLFRKQVVGLVRFLRSLGSIKSSQRKSRHQDLAAWGAGRVSEIDINNIFDHLLLKLDMTEFY